MDKQRNRTIVIKINGKDRPLKKPVNQPGLKTDGKRPENQAKQELSLKKEKKDVKIEKEAADQAAATREEAFEWILPENQRFQTIFAARKKKTQSKKNIRKTGKATKTSFNNSAQNRKMVMSVLFITLFAILVGTGFGLIMLNMVKSDQKPGTETVSSESPGFAENPAGSNPKKAFSKTVYVVQGGVFTTETAAENSRAPAMEKGLPTATIEMDNKFFLFLGVADSLDEAKLFGARLQKEGINFYAKEMIFHFSENAGLYPEETAFLKEASSLFDTLAAASITGLREGIIPAESKGKLSSQINNWEKSSESNIQKAELKTIKKELDAAVKKISSYEKEGGEKHLVGVQQHLLHVLSCFQQLS